METCIRCGVNGEIVRLFDAIYNGRMEKICERCSIIENIPIIKKPDSFQLKQAERDSVYRRMKRLAGLPEEKKEDSFFIEDRLRELEKKPELELPEKNKLNLIEYFHWEIMKNRRRKGLSQGQLAENLGESEAAIQMIEKGKLPENAESLIKKLEQFFQIKLRRISEMDRIIKEKERQKKIMLLDEKGEELERIPEPEIEILEVEEEKVGGPKEEGIGGEKPGELIEEGAVPKKIMLDADENLDIKKINSGEVTIADLRELHKRKVEATKQEQLEEKRKIEERQRLIEARKEELRLKREKEARELDKVLGGMELLEKEEGSILDENS